MELLRLYPVQFKTNRIQIPFIGAFDSKWQLITLAEDFKCGISL